MRHSPETENLPLARGTFCEAPEKGVAGRHGRKPATRQSSRKVLLYSPARTSQSWKIRTGRLSSATGLHTNQ